MTVGVGKRYFKEVKMDKQIKMSASEVDLYKYIYHSNRLKHNDIELTEASLHSMNKLLGEIEKNKTDLSRQALGVLVFRAEGNAKTIHKIQ